MKPVISLFSFALIASFALSSLGLAQNITINLDPINPPIQIPAPGGSFDYNVTVSNTGASPQTFDAWIMVQLPGDTWENNYHLPAINPWIPSIAANSSGYFCLSYKHTTDFRMDGPMIIASSRQRRTREQAICILLDLDTGSA